jgi:uncharacterized protein (TIGR02246 family)
MQPMNGSWELLDEFAQRYSAAWNSQDPTKVSDCYAPDGSLTINDGPPSIGRPAITEAARSFMTALPDMDLVMDSLVVDGDGTRYHWTFTATNTGPGGTGHRVKVSGYEEWMLSKEGLIASSLGHFDGADYDRQIQYGYGDDKT